MLYMLLVNMNFNEKNIQINIRKLIFISSANIKTIKLLIIVSESRRLSYKSFTAQKNIYIICLMSSANIKTIKLFIIVLKPRRFCLQISKHVLHNSIAKTINLTTIKLHNKASPIALESRRLSPTNLKARPTLTATIRLRKRKTLTTIKLPNTQQASPNYVERNNETTLESSRRAFSLRLGSQMSSTSCSAVKSLRLLLEEEAPGEASVGGRLAIAFTVSTRRNRIAY